jgi:hypothetical protein
MKKIIPLTILGLLIASIVFWQLDVQSKNPDLMQVTVWDTYVTKKDGSIMHFDIIAPETIKDTAIIHKYGKTYLESNGQGGQPLTAKECRRCHVRDIQPQWEADIKRLGYFILEMENCK